MRDKSFYVAKCDIEKKLAYVQTEHSRFLVSFDYDIEQTQTSLTVFVNVCKTTIIVCDDVFVDVDNMAIDKWVFEQFSLAIHDYIQKQGG
jgi:hypothetical protein